MTKKKLNGFRIRIAILSSLLLVGTLLGCIMCIVYIIMGDFLFILYGILILISYFLTISVIDSVYFLVEERLNGKKDLDNEPADKK